MSDDRRRNLDSRDKMNIAESIDILVAIKNHAKDMPESYYDQLEGDLIWLRDTLREHYNGLGLEEFEDDEPSFHDDTCASWCND